MPCRSTAAAASSRAWLSLIHIWREHLDELDRGKPVYVNCQTGLRSYLACRLLTQYGLDVYKRQDPHLSSLRGGAGGNVVPPVSGPAMRAFCLLRDQSCLLYTSLIPATHSMPSAAFVLSPVRTSAEVKSETAVPCSSLLAPPTSASKDGLYVSSFGQ